MKEKYTREEITELFEKASSPEQVRKIKRKAMHNKIKLGGLRKRFCRKCYSKDLKVKSIKRGFKNVECKKCGVVGRWRVR